MFVADMKRMFNNAKTYNSPDTIYYKCATRWVLLTYFVLTARDGYIPGQSAGNWVTSGFWRFSSWLLYHVHIILPIQSTMPFYLLNGTMSSLNLADTVYASWQTRAENLATLASGYLKFLESTMWLSILLFLVTQAWKFLLDQNCFTGCTSLNQELDWRGFTGHCCRML